MNATEARKLTNHHRSGPAIEPYMEAIYREIQKAATKGESSAVLHLAWTGSTLGVPSPAQETGIKDRLRAEGYAVTQRGGYDPRDPRDAPYDVVEW